MTTPTPSKISEAQALALFLAAVGSDAHKDIARKFDVAPSTVSGLKSGAKQLPKSVLLVLGLRRVRATTVHFLNVATQKDHPE